MNFCCRLLILALFLPFIAYPQITLQRDAYEQLLARGYSTYGGVDFEGATFNLGTPDRYDNTYDLTVFEFALGGVAEFYDASQTAFVDSFPGATHCVFSAATAQYDYYKLSDSGFYSLGMTGASQGKRAFVRVTPPEPVVVFPLEAGKSFVYRSDEIMMNPAYNFTAEFTEQFDVIAGGTLITPHYTEPCLVLSRRVNAQFRGTGFTQAANGRQYFFYTAAGTTAMIAADTSYLDDSEPPIINVLYNAANPDAVSPARIAEDGFTLHELAPNAVSGDAVPVVRWNADQRMQVNIAVFDTRGVEVAKVYDGMSEPGEHLAGFSAAALPAGMYFIRMTTPKGMQTVKFMRLN